MEENHFEKIEIGDPIVLEPIGKPYRVVFKEQTHVRIKDFGAMGAGAVLTDQKLDVLTMEEKELGQFLIYFVDKIRFKNWRQPAGVGRFFAKTTTSYIDTTYQELGFDKFGYLTRFFVFEDQVPIVDVENASGTSLSSSVVKFFGFKYKLEEIPSAPPEAKRIPIAGLALRKI
jgi:hypothetical protein